MVSDYTETHDYSAVTKLNIGIVCIFKKNKERIPKVTHAVCDKERIPKVTHTVCDSVALNEH